jgi:hypothetical protein
MGLCVRAESVVADWCILDVVDENGALQRVASSQAYPQLWEVQKSLPKGKRAHTSRLHSLPRWILSRSSVFRLWFRDGWDTTCRVRQMLPGDGTVQRGPSGVGQWPASGQRFRDMPREGPRQDLWVVALCPPFLPTALLSGTCPSPQRAPRSRSILSFSQWCSNAS